MARTLYLEGASGISGDMLVGALLDLGGDAAKMNRALESMPFDGYAVSAEKTSKWGFAGTAFHVHIQNHGHDAHAHGHGHAHAHEHEHRHLSDINALLDAGDMTPRARSLSKKAFAAVAEAEAAAHGKPVEEVHFHEVGAIDSICDTVAACVLFDDLGIEDCIVTGLSEGGGFIECAHGLLPVPVPAVLNIAAKYGIALRAGTADTELVTPTGIALAAAFRTKKSLPAAFVPVRTGIGFGTREIGRPNCLRAMLIEPAEVKSEEPARPGEGCPSCGIAVLEANVDDCTGEELGFAMKRLFAAGARDCHFLPCYMKKNRPGWLVRVIADESLVPELEKILFSATTTIGVRRQRVERTVMDRKTVRVAVDGGEVLVKICTYGGIVRIHPEAESVQALCEKTGRRFDDVSREAILNCRDANRP